VDEGRSATRSVPLLLQEVRRKKALWKEFAEEEEDMK